MMSIPWLLCEESDMASSHLRFSSGARLPLNRNCSGTAGATQSEMRPEPASAGTSHETVKLSCSRSFEVIATFM